MCKAIEDMKKHAKEDDKAEGIQEGIIKGEEKNLNNNIKTMHSNGFDVNTIAKALSLDINYVKKVLA